MSRRLPHYDTPEDQECPECNLPCKIIPKQNEFSYPGTHCTHGQAGIHYPVDWGDPISDCCEAEIEL